MIPSALVPGQNIILAADGTPLAIQVQRSLRHRKRKAFLLVLPLLAFILFFFIIPIANLMVYSVDDRLVNRVLKNTYAVFDQWDRTGLPPEFLYEAMYKDIVGADRLDIGKVSTRMNYVKSGFKSLMKVSRRQFQKIENPPYKEQMIAVNPRWGDAEFWLALGTMQPRYTSGYYANAVDLRLDADLSLTPQPEERRVYVSLWYRTLLISALVTLFCLLLGMPVSYLLANLPVKYSNLLMICVLLPFWTALLVRITAWVVMLQRNGVVNDTLVALGILDDAGRLSMMYNFTGTIIVMTQVLLPFMILPIYSVMKNIPTSYMRAAENLGATSIQAFLKVYLPQTMPGIGAGGLLVFILAVGYFITPEIVGGKDGYMIGNAIAHHMRSTLNWGLAASMGMILLVSILILYWLYDKVVGIDNMKLG